MAALTVLQYHAFGSDEDVMGWQLMDGPEAQMAPDEGRAPADVRAAWQVAAVIAGDQRLRYAAEAPDMGSKRGDFLLVNDWTWREGDVLKTPAGKQYRIRFEEVK
jgi:hypothetical protein